MPRLLPLSQLQTNSPSLETEMKYVAPAHKLREALRMLENSCEPDPKFPVGIVSSIYYDTRNWDYLREKRESDYLKTKIRVRWYEQISRSNETSDISHAEVKHRIGCKRSKIRLATVHSGQYLAGLKLNDSALLRIPAVIQANGIRIRQPIFPAFTISYNRRRFVDRCTNTRVALDYEINVPKSNPLMLGAVFPCVLSKIVLEIKGTDGEYPRNLRNLLKLGFRKEAFSKYYECYGQLTQTFF